MSILKILRKLGILHSGGGTYKGKVGGDYATIDMNKSRGKADASAQESAEESAE